MRARRTRRMRVSGCSSRIRRSRLAGGRSRTEARRFEFTTESPGMARRSARPPISGVISAVFFKERVQTIASESAELLQRRRSPASAPAPPAAAAEQNIGEAASAKKQSRRRVRRHRDGSANRSRGDAGLDGSEETPAKTVNIRYEFRPQLVRLGVLPATPIASDPLPRRERARGFEPGFSPEAENDGDG